MGFLGELGMSAANAATGGAIGTGLGLLLEKHNDKRQLAQQNKLSQQQLAFDKSKMDYQNEKQLQMWEATNYAAQKEQMKKAGLSPGLIYGQSGGGGTTVGAGAASVGGPSAPQGGGEVMGLQLMEAQRQLLQAQTEKTKAETTKTAGIDTQLGEKELELKTIAASLAEDTYWDSANKLQAEAEKLGAEAREANMRAQLYHETYWVKKDAAEAELIGLSLANELKRKQSNLTDEKIKSVVAEVQQKWMGLEIQRGQLNLNRFVHDIADSTKLTAEVVSNVVGNIVSFNKTKLLTNAKKK